MKLVRRFFSYYKPHKRLFLLDLVCSFTISVCNMFYPMIARNIMNDYVPNQNLRLLIVWAIVLAAIYALKSVLTYIVGYWGHVLGVRIQGDMRRALDVYKRQFPDRRGDHRNGRTHCEFFVRRRI